MFINYNPKKNIIGYIYIIISIIIILFLFYFLNNKIYLPYSYFISFLLLYILVIFTLFQHNRITFLTIIILYTIAVTSVFSFKYGIYHGDSQNELSVVISIIRTNFLPHFSQYDPSSFPILHIFTISMGSILGYNTVDNISVIAAYIPTINAVICVTFLYLLLLDITKNNRISYFTCLIWVSLPFINRWLIQYTRTTFTLPFIVIFGYILLKKKTLDTNYVICTYIIILTMIFAHPVVSFFCLIMLIYLILLKYCNIDKNTILRKKYIYALLFYICILLIYWTYISDMIYPFKNTISGLYYSYKSFFSESILSLVIKGDPKAGASTIVASKISTYFGFFRVFLFYFLSFIGIIYGYRINKINMPLFLSLFGFIIAGIGLGAGLSSTTFYRVSVYSSFCICISLAMLLSSKHLIKKVIIIISLIILVVPTPIFIGEVVLPSDWIYYANSNEYINYEKGETQRYTEDYLMYSALWIEEYTPNDATIWSDGTHSYGDIKGYGNRRPTYIAVPLDEVGFNLDDIYLKELYFQNEVCTIKYVLITELMKKSLYIPYGIPSFYPSYNFETLYIDDRSNIIYNSNDAQLFVLI